MLCTRISMLASCLSLFALTIAPPAIQQPETSPPIPARALPPVDPGAPVGGAVRAVVVKSWGAGGASAWAELNSEWPQYGTTPIQIDTTLGGVATFTYTDLVASGADVIIISNPAGGAKQYSPQEIAAVRDYAVAGHNVIATYLTFSLGNMDNSELAPIFGLVFDASPGTFNPALSNVFVMLMPNHFLMRGLGGSTWQSAGYPFSQTPRENASWTAADLAGASVIAQCDDFTAIVSIYRSRRYSGIYISNMPEYFGSTTDKQLLYNAITCPPGADLQQY